MQDKLRLSPLAHTWVLDLDGTLLKHNGYKTEEGDTLLKGAREFLDAIPKKDFILIATSRGEEEREGTISFLKKHKIRYNEIVFGLPYGERILLNDDKPSGLKTAFALSKVRDGEDFPKFCEDETL